MTHSTLDLDAIRRRREAIVNDPNRGVTVAEFTDAVVEFTKHAPDDIDALLAEVTALRAQLPVNGVR